MKKELDRSKASYKLDLIETANADPILSPYDFKVLVAYVAVMSWPSCRAWLSPTLAMSMTGLSHGQFWKSRAVLLGKNPADRAYLLEGRATQKTVSNYQLVNPWRDEARAHVEAMTGYHKEVARKKKEQKRANLSIHGVEGQEPACPSTIRSSVPPHCGVYTPLMITPRKKGVREEDIEGGTVVLLNQRRRGNAG